MSYRVLFNTLDNEQAKDLREQLTAQGHSCYNSGAALTDPEVKEKGLDLLVLSIPETGTEKERHATILDEMDFPGLQQTLSENVNEVLQTALDAIPYLRRSKLKRIVLLTQTSASIRETTETTGYARHMSQAAANMIMKILFNTYRSEGFTFRCYAGREDGEKPDGIDALEYIFTEQSYVERDNPKHSDENRLVMRDEWLRELSW